MFYLVFSAGLLLIELGLEDSNTGGQLLYFSVETLHLAFLLKKLVLFRLALRGGRLERGEKGWVWVWVGFGGNTLEFWRFMWRRKIYVHQF